MANRFLNDVEINGNVGIGTTSPAHPLTVVGQISSMGGTNNEKKISISANDSWGYINTDAANFYFNKAIRVDTGGIGSYNEDLQLKTGSTTRVSILNSNGYVGIGTTSPDVRLEVIEASPTNGIVADFVNSSNAAGTTAAIKLSNADSDVCDVILGANRIGANFGSDFFISLSDSVDGSNQERFRITEAGNVGIGTASPSRKLSVAGAIELAGVDTTLSTGNPAIRRGSSGEMFLDAPGNVTVTIDSNNNQTTALFNVRKDASTELFRIQENGNVGIGAANPLAKLQVGDGTEDTAVRAYHSDASYTEMRGYGLQFSRTSSYIRPTSDGNKTMYFGTDGATWNAIVFDATIYDFKTNGTSRLSIDASGNANFANNVTVGGNLIVNGTTTTLNTQTVEVEDNILQLNTTQGTPDTATAATSGISVYRGNGVTQASLVFDEADDTWDLTNNLQVSGVISSVSNIEDGTAQISILNANTSPPSEQFYVGNNLANVDLGNKRGALKLFTGTSEKMRIDASGKVGIGTTSPSNTTHIYKNATIGALVSTTTSNAGLRIQDNASSMYFDGNSIVLDSAGYLTTTGNNDFSIGTNNVTRLFVKGDGNVGIGTVTPGALLHVKAADNVTGTIEIEGGKSTVTSAGEINSELNFGSRDSSATGGIGGSIKSVTENTNGAYVGMSFYTAQQSRSPVLKEAMRITNSGAISFGSTGTAYGTSGQLLTSNGNGSPTWQDAPASGPDTVTVTGSTGSRTTTIVEGLNLAGVENLGMPTTGGYTVMGISNGSGSVAAGTVVSFHDSDTTENDDPFAVDLRSNGDYFWNMHGRLTIEQTNQNRGGDLEVGNNIGWGGDLSGAGADGQQLVGMSNGDSISAASVHIGASGKVHLHGSSGSYNLEIHQTGAADIELNAFAGELQVAGAGITPGTDASPNTLGVGADGRLQTVNVGYTPLAVTKNGSNQFPVVFANAENFSLSCAGAWTITATIASGDIGKTGTIIITNTATTTPGSLPSTFKTPNGDSIVFQTDSGDVSIMSYLVVSTSIVLVNYVGNFS